MKMKKTVTCLLFLMLTMAFLSHSVASAEEQAGVKEGSFDTFTEYVLPDGFDSEMTVWMVTDLHYLSEELNDYGPLFQKMLENGDGKDTGHAVAIFDRLIELALEKKPKALIASGDLTFNGEYLSLQAEGEAFDRLEAAGIDVLVIPGNHDIYGRRAYKYQGEEAFYAKAITDEDFHVLCDRFGYEEAQEQAPDSFSYLYALSDDVKVLMLDANTSAKPGWITEDTLEWAKGVLEAEKEAGNYVFSVSHQNVLMVNDSLGSGYLLSNFRSVRKLLAAGGITRHFSGHAHVQAQMVDDDLTEVCTSSLCVTPLHYGVIDIGRQDGAMDLVYHNESIDRFQQEARDFFDSCSEVKLRPQLQAAGVADEELEQMLALGKKLNRVCFEGKTPIVLEEEDQAVWELWKKYGEKIWMFEYIASLVKE